MSELATATAITLNRRRFSERDLVATALAEDGRLLSLRGHGLAATRRRSALLLEPGCRIHVHYYVHQNDRLMSIKEGEIQERYADLKEDYASLTMMAQLLETAAVGASLVGEAKPESYTLLAGALAAWRELREKERSGESTPARREIAERWLRAFVKLRFLNLAGLLGESGRCSECGEPLGDDAAWNLPEARFSCDRCDPDADRQGGLAARLLAAMASRRFSLFLSSRADGDAASEGQLASDIDRGLIRCLEHSSGRSLRSAEESD